MRKWIDMHCDTLSELLSAETLEENSLCVDRKRMEQTKMLAEFFACFVCVPDGKWEEAYQKVIEMIARMERETKENKKLKEDGQKQMTRIRLASNGADVNVQILMEVINSLCWQLQVKEFRPTDHMLHPAMDEARKVVKERIANYKQAKDFHAKN